MSQHYDNQADLIDYIVPHKKRFTPIESMTDEELLKEFYRSCQMVIQKAELYNITNHEKYLGEMERAASYKLAVVINMKARKLKSGSANPDYDEIKAKLSKTEKKLEHYKLMTEQANAGIQREKQKILNLSHDHVKTLAVSKRFNDLVFDLVGKDKHSQLWATARAEVIGG